MRTYASCADFSYRRFFHSGERSMAKERNKDIFETMPVPLAVRTMALPTIISQLIVLIYNMADTFYLGRTNNPFMVAGVSLILPVFNICLSLAGLSGIGGGGCADGDAVGVCVFQL